MPIRFDDGGGSNRNSGNQDGQGKGPIMLFLAFLFMLWKYPKFTFFLVVVAGIGYYLYSNPKISEEYLGFNINEQVDEGLEMLHGTGCQFDQAKYDAVEVYEPLASEGLRSGEARPDQVSLRQYAPPRRSQGSQGSCVGWATAYAARTVWEASATKQNPKNLAYSPAYLYNLNRYNNDCEGAILADAMRFMQREGLVLDVDFPYDESTCTKQPSSSLKAKAKEHRIRGYQRLTVGGNNYDVDQEAVKQYLAQGCPVTIAMNVPSSFDNPSKVWKPRSREYDNPAKYGGHAMCVIGYDDNMEGGAFEIMNSWGANWGDKGCVWVRYEDFKVFCREAFGFYPKEDKKQEETRSLDVSVGLLAFPNAENIKLERKSGQVFAPSAKLKKGDKFRLEVRNEQECYVYVFGEETDGQAYSLFPYTPQHSAFCGITGTRHFPKDGMESLRIDDLGNKDRMAVVVSRKALDYKDLVSKMNKKKGNFEQKVIASLGNSHFSKANLRNSQGRAAFKGQAATDLEVAVAFVVEIEK